MDHQGGQLVEAAVPHVLIFPLPIQSSINSMVKLGELLCSAGGIHVTLLITKYNHKRLLRCTNIQTRLARYQGRFHLEAIDDGLPEEDPRDVGKFAEILDSLQNVAEPFLREFLQGSCSNSRIDKLPLITCVVAEGLLYYAFGITEECGIPFIFFETISPCCLWVYFCLNKLIQAGDLPFKGNDLDALVTSIPGMEGLLMLRDLPDFCRRDYNVDGNARLVMESIRAIPRAAGLILNSFAELDGQFLSHLRSKVRSLYSIGPVQLLLKETTLAAQQSEESPNLSNSFWEEDKSCLRWLDSQPSKSVIYISFGSLTNLSSEEFLEFWHGITNSGHSFLWVIRPDSIQGQKQAHHEFLEELNKSTKGSGLIVGWVPQEEVLAHNAIGGFLTHSGWNSTLESIIEGVPMICWPKYVDQQVTSRFVPVVWRLGLDMKDTLDRLVIETKIKDLMEKKDDGYEDSAKRWSKSARESVAEGGSSYSDFQRLVQDIKNLSLKSKS